MTKTAFGIRFLIALILNGLVVSSFAQAPLKGLSEGSLSKANLLYLNSFSNGVAEFKVSLCPPDAPVKVDVEFTPSSQPERLQFANLIFLVPSMQCYANTFATVRVNIQEVLKRAVSEKKIQSEIVLMNSLPYHAEVMSDGIADTGP
jgi:hypothetical protein